MTGPTQAAKQNIILIGPMGVGKTTIGRHLAKQMHKRFVDSDHAIEERTGVAISLIFDIEGEQGFRDREEKMIAELVAKENIVLATGGGAVLREANRGKLRAGGTVVYLHASVDTQLRRTRNAKNRPLLQTENPRDRLESLMRVREPLYRETADIVVNADRQAAAQVAKIIIRKLQQQHARNDTQG